MFSLLPLINYRTNQLCYVRNDNSPHFQGISVLLQAAVSLSDPGIFDSNSLSSAIKNQLENIGLVSDDSDRTLDVGSGLSGLVSGGFDKLGYIPLATAVGQCEGQARAR